MDKNILYIVEIEYETGEIHFRYSRRMSDDETKWIQEGLFTEYYRNGNIAQQDYTLMVWKMVTGRIFTRMVKLRQKAIMQREKKLENGFIMMKKAI